MTTDPWNFTGDKEALKANLAIVEQKLAPLEARLKEEREKVDQKALADCRARRDAMWKAKQEAFEKMMTAHADALIASGAYLFKQEDRERFQSNHFRPSQVNPVLLAHARTMVGLAEGDDLGSDHFLLSNIAHTVGEKFAETYPPYVRAKALHEALDKVSTYQEEEDLLAGIRAASTKEMEHLRREATDIQNMLTSIRMAEETNPKTKKGRMARAAMAARLIYGGYRGLGWTTKPCKECGHINDHQARGVGCRECMGDEDPCYLPAGPKEVA